MKFHQIFECVDAASLGVDDENRIEIIQAFLTSDYEEEESKAAIRNSCFSVVFNADMVVLLKNI